MTVHDLSCLPDLFRAMLDGRKRFEIRYDDRGYTVGDRLRISERTPGGDYTGRSVIVEVMFMSRGNGLPEGMVVMGLGAPFDVLDRCACCEQVSQTVAVRRIMSPAKICDPCAQEWRDGADTIEKILAARGLI